MGVAADLGFGWGGLEFSLGRAGGAGIVDWLEAKERRVNAF